MLYGYGAGDLPTGSAVLADIMAIARGDSAQHHRIHWPRNCPWPTSWTWTRPRACTTCASWSRTSPGCCATSAGPWPTNGISIAQAIQKGEAPGPGRAHRAVDPHEAKADDIHKAMRQVEAMGLT